MPTLIGFAACVTSAELYGHVMPKLDIIIASAGAADHVPGCWVVVGSRSFAAISSPDTHI